MNYKEFLTLTLNTGGDYLSIRGREELGDYIFTKTYTATKIEEGMKCPT